MSINFITALKAEITELESELRKDPRQRKLQKLRETLAEYERSPNGNQASNATLSSVVSITPFVTKQDKIKAELKRLCQEHGSIHRSNFLKHLIQIGLMGNEKNPKGSVAAYLSGWRKEFTSDGKGNWSLRPQAAE